jgi:glycosyltransferase involved in cell wall biosynthesis
MDERPTPKALPMRLATHIIGPSRYVVGDTQRRFRLKDKPGLVLPPLLPDADSVREPEARLIVFQGPLVRSKGGDVAIRAIQLVDAKLAVVGQGPERPSLEALASELDVSCEFTRTPQLHRAAVAVVPSREEPFGMAAVEAMRAGVPVVATFAGGLPETVGEAGVLVEESNAYALAEALRDMLDDPALAAGFAERGRMRFKTRYALASRLEEQLDAIEALSS